MFRTNNRRLQRILKQHRLRQLIPKLKALAEVAERKANVEEDDPQGLHVALDPMGRAMDRTTGLYLKRILDLSVPGGFLIQPGSEEGDFLTLDREGDLIVWEPPKDYVVN